MRLVLMALLLVSFNVYAGSLGVYLSSGSEGQIAADVREALNHELSKHIQDIHVFRVQEAKSYIKLSVKDPKIALKLARELNDGRVTLMQGMMVAWVSSLEIFKVPTFMGIEDVERKNLLTYGYFKVERPTIYEDRVGVMGLSISLKKNVEAMREMAQRIPENVGEYTFERNLKRHHQLVNALSEMQVKGLRGAICDSLYCSCFGTLSCLSVKNTCQKLHESLDDSLSEKFTCTKDVRGLCIAGSCRLH